MVPGRAFVSQVEWPAAMGYQCVELNEEGLAGRTREIRETLRNGGMAVPAVVREGVKFRL